MIRIWLGKDGGSRCEEKWSIQGKWNFQEKGGQHNPHKKQELE